MSRRHRHSSDLTTALTTFGLCVTACVRPPGGNAFPPHQLASPMNVPSIRNDATGAFVAGSTDGCGVRVHARSGKPGSACHFEARRTGPILVLSQTQPAGDKTVRSDERRVAIG